VLKGAPRQVACKASAISFSSMAPSRMIFQYGSVISTVVAPAPEQVPPSSTRSTRRSRSHRPAPDPRAGAGPTVQHQIHAAVHGAEDLNAAAAGGRSGDDGASRDQRLVQGRNQSVGDLGARLPQRQTTGVASHLRGHAGGQYSISRVLWMTAVRMSPRQSSVRKVIDLALNLGGPRGIADCCIEVAQPIQRAFGPNCVAQALVVVCDPTHSLD